MKKIITEQSVVEAPDPRAEAPSMPPAGFSDTEEPTSPAVPHPSVKPSEASPERHYDATTGSRFSVRQANIEAIMHQAHQLLDDSRHAIEVGLLPAGCHITIILEP